jgi:hypothetical protein
MDIAKAKTLKLGQTVHFPADRGNPAGSGQVVFIGRDAVKNLQGQEYVWVALWNKGAPAGVWPSNRLG